MHSQFKGYERKGHGPTMRHTSKPLSEMHSFRRVKPSTIDVSKSAMSLKLLRHQGFENYPSLTEKFWQNCIIERGRSLPGERGSLRPTSAPQLRLVMDVTGQTVNALPTSPGTTHQSLIRPVLLNHQFYQSLQFGTVVSELCSAPLPWRARVSRTPADAGPGAALGGDGCFQLLTPQPGLCTLSAF